MATYQPSKLILQSQSIAGRKRWQYEDTGPLSDVVGSGFVTDARNKGADSGDFVEYTDTSRRITYGLRFSALTDTGATQGTLDGAVIISDTS